MLTVKKIGLDVGSTTIKCVVLDDNNEIIYSNYERHMSRIVEMTHTLLCRIEEMFPNEDMSVVISGSAGMGMATGIGIPFTQEVYATRTAVKTYLPETDTVIELAAKMQRYFFFQADLKSE